MRLTRKQRGAPRARYLGQRHVSAPWAGTQADGSSRERLGRLGGEGAPQRAQNAVLPVNAGDTHTGRECYGGGC